MMRQTGKQILTLRRLRLFLAALFLFPGLGANILAPAGALGATGQVVPSIVVDPLSGVALDGYDAISYFTEEEPLSGRPEFEYYWLGVPWYFSSAANLEVFSRAPEVYAPQFGGHAAMSLARGFMSDGNPLIYAVLNNRLYLFYSFGNRSAFLLGDKNARVEANGNWPRAGAQN